MTAARIEHILIGGDPKPWQELGMTVVDDTIWLHGTGMRFVDGESGIRGLAISGLDQRAVGDEFAIDGLPCTAVEPSSPVLVDHPLGVVDIDHVVIATGSLERTSDAVTAETGAVRKRIRETDEVRQGFHRLGNVIVEIVEMRASRPDGGYQIDETAGDDPARFFGLAFNLDDIDVVSRLDPELVGRPKDAVQPGRQIATVRSAAGLGVPVAFMSR